MATINAPTTAEVCEAANGCASGIGKFAKDTFEEVKYECIPSQDLTQGSTWKGFFDYSKDFFHIPYFPSLSNPGWLVQLFYSPKDEYFWEGVYGDIFAGFTVGFAVVPQALSYAQLAGLPPIYGLYAVIFPSIVYIFMGSGMQLAVGPVALVSLLTNQLMVQYDIKNPEDAVDFGAQLAFCSGILMLGMGLLNLGNLIRFISYPVMSGFTTASAVIIGLNQIKNAFGFPSAANVPQVGGAVEYNYEVMEWYHENWNGKLLKKKKWYLYRNVHATNITFGIYVPLMLLFAFKMFYKPTDEVKKSWQYKLFSFIVTCATLISLIIAGHEAYLIHNFNDTYHARALKVVGNVPPGLDIFRLPHFKFPLGKVFVDVIPLTVVSFMESYSVARKTSALRGQLSILNASQELVALGIGNIANCIFSGYPVSGSFSRSSLYASNGARTPLAKTVTLTIVLVALGSLTKTFYFIPQAALAAVVMVAVASLIDFHEMWVAWKLSKKDFFVMFATFIFTFVYETQVGLAVGVGLSIVVLLRDLAYSLEAKPITRAFNFKGVEIIRLNSNLVFVSAQTIKDTLINEIFEKPKEDTPLRAVVLDFIDVKHADMSGLISMQEVMNNARKNDLRVFIVNVIPEVQSHLDRAGIQGDELSACSPDLQDAILAAQAFAGGSAAECIDVESLGMVTEMLRESKAGSLIELATYTAAKNRSSGTSAKSSNDGDGESLRNPTNASYALVVDNEHQD